MIIRGGENIYPREIEEFLYQLEGVKDVQVAGIPSKSTGEAVGAFIILHERVDDARIRCTRFLHRQNITLQDTQVYLLHQRIPHDGKWQDTEIQAERPGITALQGAGD